MNGFPPFCPYCGNISAKVTGEAIYPHRPDLHHLVFFSCEPCGAYVGTHEATGKPLGRLANAELRKAKQMAHSAFDPLWKEGDLTRKQAYALLAKRMRIAVEDCHIGEFDVEQCDQVGLICWEV